MIVGSNCFVRPVLGSPLCRVLGEFGPPKFCRLREGYSLHTLQERPCPKATGLVGSVSRLCMIHTLNVVQYRPFPIRLHKKIKYSYLHIIRPNVMKG